MNTQDTVKAAAEYLRETLNSEGVELGSSHAHAAISAYCGYNSKKALLDNGPDTTDLNLVLTIDPDIENLAKQVAKMKGDPLNNVSINHLADLIQTAITPECECCGAKMIHSRPIGDSRATYFEPDGWVCPDCASYDDEYASCRFCGSDVIYRADQINERGECSEHDGESVISEEEEQDWDDYIENITKDL
jgi:hypothetical protein